MKKVWLYALFSYNPSTKEKRLYCPILNNGSIVEKYNLYLPKNFFMPLIKSAKKQLKQNHKKKARNDHFKGLYREARVAFETAIKAKDKATAQSLLWNQKDADGKTTKAGLQAIIDKLVKKNIIHRNNGARKKGKFMRMIKELS